MPDRSGLSRRGLFSLGLSRLGAEPDDEEPAVADVAEPGRTPQRQPQPQLQPQPRLPEEDLAARVERMQRAWDGCLDSDLWAQAASVLVARARPAAGELVLDAGAGDGSVALLAAADGASVTACDISPALVARGARRSAEAGAAVTWLAADLAALPFPDASFDHVLSGFGPMFCHDGRVAIDELFRVVRPGGTVAFTAWPGRGAVGRLLRLAAALDPPPSGMPGPLAWGREERLRQDLEFHSDEVVFETAELDMRFHSAQDAVDRLVRAFGPLAAITPGDELRAGVRAMVDELGRYDEGPVALAAPFLVVTAERRVA